MTFRYDFNDPDCIKRATGIKGADACGSNGYVKAAAGSMQGRTIKIEHLGCSYHLDRGSFVDFINSKLPKAEQLEKGYPDVGGASDEQITACAVKVLGVSVPLEHRGASIKWLTARALLSTLARTASPELRKYMDEQGFKGDQFSNSEVVEFFRLHIVTAPLALRESVTSLDFGYYRFDEFPSELKIFPNLKKVVLEHCTGLQSLAGIEGLVALEEIEIRGVHSFVSMEGVKGLPNLKKVVLKNCSQLQSLAGIEELVALEEIVIYAGQSFASMEGVKALPNLKKVVLHSCPRLQSLAGIEGLIALEEIEIRNANSFISMEGVKSLPNLKKVVLEYCPQLQPLAGIEGLIALEELTIGGSKSLVSMEGVKTPPNLKTVVLSNCPRLQSLAGIDALLGLESLRLVDCAGLHSLEGVEGVLSLKSLELARCFKLRSLSAIEKLSNLEVLELHGLEGLADTVEVLKEIEKLPKLKELILYRSLGIGSFADLECLSRLENLTIRGFALRTMQGIKVMESLKTLTVNDHDYNWFASVAGVGQAPNLERVELTCSQSYLNGYEAAFNKEGFYRIKDTPDNVYVWHRDIAASQ